MDGIVESDVIVKECRIDCIEERDVIRIDCIVESDVIVAGLVTS